MEINERNIKIRSTIGARATLGIAALELAKKIKSFEHLIYASSSSIYGSNKKIPFSINDRVDNPIS